MGMTDASDQSALTAVTAKINAHFARADSSAKKAVSMLAIAGAPGSGKSSVAVELAKQIDMACCIIPMDGFHLDNETLMARGLLSAKGAPETFDLAGFHALIEKLQTGETNQFPIFDRDKDRTIENGGSVPDGTTMLLFEGNYLLFDQAGWRDLAAKWDASLWLDVPEAVLEQRLIRRWLDQGMGEDKARERAHSNDLVNAKQVLAKALPANWVLANY